MAELEDMFTVDYVSKRWFGGKKKKVYEAVEQKKIPFLRMGRELRFPESAIREWIESQTVKPKAQTQGESLPATT